MLLKHECNAMQMFFPQFKLDKLDDGRYCWIGIVNPRGKDGGVWTLQAVYDHNHPHNDSYGGSVKIYSVAPSLEDLVDEVGELPHLLEDSGGSLYMCTARKEDVINTEHRTTSAVTSIGWAIKWIWHVEGWLNGEVGDDEAFSH
ncbi:MAG: hypothetical protein FWB78_08100 [Treponema sp.]|nr:hypothetical protein [Treponema sp.]